MRIKLILSIVICIVLFSCSDDKSVDPKPEPKNYEIPNSYNFENVDISDQLVRMQMLEEMKKLISDAIANKTAISAGALEGMYKNLGTPFFDPTLNNSPNNLYSQTDPSRTTFFEGYFKDMNNVSTTKIAGNNKKGILITKDGTQTFLVDSVGKEYMEVLEKGIMGALFYYQVAQVLTSNDKIGDNVDNKTVIEGQGTAMQHHWDEAYGYFGAPLSFPETTTDLRYTAKLCNDRNSVLNTNNLIMKEGFLKGRAAINNDDKQGKLDAVAKIKKYWELILVSSAVHHLKIASTNFDDTAIKHHELTIAWMLLWSIQSNPDSNGLIYENAQAKIGTNYWNTVKSDVDEAIDILVKGYKLEDVKDAL